MKISLINAEQYFKRKDLKSIPWFAISNNILEHPDFFDVTGNEFKAFIWIIGVAAKCKKIVFDLDLKHAAYMARLDENDFQLCINKLSGKRIQVVEITEDVTSSSRVRNRSVPNITEHNKTELKNIKKEIQEIGGSDEPSETYVSPAQILFWIWNENRGSLPEAVALSKKRESAAKRRWKEVPDEAYWKNIATLLSKSEFCCGKNERKWKADFDFFVKPDTHFLVLEGKYGCNSATIERQKVIF